MKDFFQSELFVVNSVRTSELAFSAATEKLSASALNSVELLKILKDPNQLKAHTRLMGSNNTRDDDYYHQIFSTLEKSISSAFKPRATSLLTRKRLSLLLNEDVQEALAIHLGCHPREVVATLFSIEELRDTLDYLNDDGSESNSNNAVGLLSEILKHGGSLEEEHCVTGNDWEFILKEEQWLEQEDEPKSKAVQKLEALVSDTTNPYIALATLIERSQKDDVEQVKNNSLSLPNSIGSLGLIEVRRRLLWIINQLYEQANENFDAAAAVMPTSSTFELLPAVFHLYNLGWTLRGLKNYISPPITLSKVLTEDKIERNPVDVDAIALDQSLEFEVLEEFSVYENKYWSFEIRCGLKNKKFHTFLTAYEIRIEIAQEIQREISTLTPRQLGFSEKDLCDSLLESPFLNTDPVETLLRDAINELGLEKFSQIVAFSCSDPIEGVPPIWRKVIPEQLPYEELRVAADPVYSNGPAEIVRRYQEEYQAKIDIVKGIQMEGTQKVEEAVKNE